MEKRQSQPDACLEDFYRGRFIPKGTLFKAMFRYVKSLAEEDPGESDFYFHARYSDIVDYLLRRKIVFHDYDLKEVMDGLVELGYLIKVGGFGEDGYIISVDAFTKVN